MFTDEHQLDQALSAPTPEVVDTLQRVDGDVILLGAAGKMGYSLARMIRRAFDLARVRHRVIAVSRFRSVTAQEQFEHHGIETIRGDLLDEQFTNALPDAAGVVSLAGMKFGATGNESLTWAMNVLLPAAVCRRFRHSRIVALSTGNVYGLTSVHSGGSKESDELRPVGEYAMSCLGRERVFEHCSQTLQIPAALIRLNYACDLRYGVLVDIAQAILNDRPVDVSMGWFNTIWQGDACAWTLQALDHVQSPPGRFNVTGPEIVSVRQAARQMATRMNRTVEFTGQETDSSLLSNCRTASSLFAPLRVSAEQLINGVADWIMAGGRTLNKPTHFESRDGKF